MRASIAIFVAGVAAHTFSPVQRDLVQRDAALIKAAIAAVSSSTTSLDNAIKGYSGDAQSAALLAASNAVVASIQDGTNKIRPSDNLDIDGSFSLIPDVQALGSLVQTTINDAKAKKQAFVDACQGPTVLDQLKQQQAAAKDFAAAITSKVPEAAKPIADEQSAPILAALADGVSSFADQTSLPAKCAASSSGAAPTSSGAAPTATVSASFSASISVPQVTGTATSKATQSGAVPTGNASTCVGVTTTVTVTVPGHSVPTGSGVVPPKPTTSATKTWSHGKPTPTPSPPAFTGAAVANGANFGAAAIAALAIVAAL